MHTMLPTCGGQLTGDVIDPEDLLPVLLLPVAVLLTPLLHVLLLEQQSGLYLRD